MIEAILPADFSQCESSSINPFATLRVSVTTVHEAVDECIVDAVFFGDVAKFEKMNH